VIPFPGTPDASPQTRIILPSLTPADLESITVTGSISGPHLGRLVRLPDRAGTAFAPDRGFAPGERVHVSAQLASTAAGTAAGLASGRGLSYWFRVGLSTRRAADLMEAQRIPVAAARGRPTGKSFHSVPGLQPPTVKASGDPDSRSGYIFVAPRLSYQRKLNIQSGPMILNSQGQLVWFRNIPGGLAMNLEAQTYDGRPVLSWWQGTPNWSMSEDVIADNSYRTLAVLHAGNGFATDSHELQITPRGTAIIDATAVARANLTAFGGSATGLVQDDIVQELDIKTGQVLWEWHSYGHVPLSASYTRPQGKDAYDYFHLNSVQQLPDGNFLVSARHTWAIYEIDRATGKIIWTLGGKDSDFRLGPGADFSWQHDGQLTGNTLSLFDDASDGPEQEENQSSAKVLRLNLSTMTATLLHRYTHSPPLLAVSQGNTQRLPNGDLFVGWGADPEFSEYTPNGKQIFNASFVLGVNTYRAYRFPWTGRPTIPPDLDISPAGRHHLKLYASWNGATGVAAWRVLGGDRPTSLSYVTRATRTGFETTIKLTSALPYLAVQALNSRGSVMTTSPPERNPG
jgi:outer membrane protein assembly factor BamB